MGANDLLSFAALGGDLGPNSTERKREKKKTAHVKTTNDSLSSFYIDFLPGIHDCGRVSRFPSALRFYILSPFFNRGGCGESWALTSLFCGGAVISACWSGR